MRMFNLVPTVAELSSAVVSRSLTDSGVDFDEASDRYGTALVGAAFLGSFSGVQMLLDQGADMNAVGGTYGTAMTAAVSTWRRCIDIITLLLDRGADINTPGGDYGTPLAAAAFKGKMDVLSLLLDRGANVNAVGGIYGTALAAAAFKGAKDIVLRLLDRGADIHTVGGVYGTALGAAAFSGEVDTMTLLLDRGANINAVGGEFGTALSVTALTEHTLYGPPKSMTLLLNKNADINAVGGEYGSPLAVAAFQGNMKAALFLLHRAADIHAGGDKYGSALPVAAFYNRMEIAQLLLDQGADINVAGSKYGTALAAAAFNGHMDIVLMLLERGADIKAVDSKYGTAVAAAAFGGHTDLVSLLLERGAPIDVNIKTVGDGENMDIVAQLLEHGADVICARGSYSTPSGLYSSALDLAHSEGNKTDPALLALLKTAIRKQHGPQTQSTYPNTKPVNHAISQPPLSKPETTPGSPLCTMTGHRKTTLLLSPPLSSIVPSELRAGGNITPEQADVSCRSLNEDVLWRSLAALIGLNKDKIQAEHLWIQNDIRYFVACDLDFGLAYAIARVAWKSFNEYAEDSSGISLQRGKWHERAQVLDQERQKAIEADFSNPEQQLITSPYEIMPRRLWDLRSNRVINFRMLHAVQSGTPDFWAVTHSWTSNMSPVWTTINQHQWGVPLPNGISLESVRSELLTMGAEYVWIDVLCLRQSSKVSYLENLKREEWKVDVPTIGNVYRSAGRIVRYFNGLGVPFSYSGWDDARHWLQRAWTLQEIADENTTINGGTPRDRGQVLLNSQSRIWGRVIKLRDAIRPVTHLAAQVDGPHGCEVYELVQEMNKRHASQPVDKISGLFYLLRTTKLPCYDTQMSCEEFWKQCFHLLPHERKAEILFDFPYRGTDQWFPTWTQVLKWPTRDPAYLHKRFQSSPNLMKNVLGDTSFFISNLLTISHAVLSKSEKPGEYEVRIGGSPFGFYLPFVSQKPIELIQGQSSKTFGLANETVNLAKSFVPSSSTVKGFVPGASKVSSFVPKSFVPKSFSSDKPPPGKPIFTLATMDVGPAHNWVVCKAIQKKVGADAGLVGVSEVTVLKKVGVIRTDACSELLVANVLQRMDCLFV